MGGCLYDRLLTVGVFYSQQKQAIDDALASSRADTASTETRERNSVVHQKCTNFHWSLNETERRHHFKRCCTLNKNHRTSKELLLMCRILCLFS